MGIIISDFISLFLEPYAQKVNVWRARDQTIVFNGYLSDLKYTDMADCEILSIDTFFEANDTMTINIF